MKIYFVTNLKQLVFRNLKFSINHYSLIRKPAENKGKIWQCFVAVAVADAFTLTVFAKLMQVMQPSGCNIFEAAESWTSLELFCLLEIKSEYVKATSNLASL